MPMRAEASSLDYAECSRKCPIKGKAAPADSLPFGGGFLVTCEAALNHCVIDVLELESGDFLSLVFVAGFDFYCVAVAVECDYFHCEVFVFAVGVERAAEDVCTNVCHDFEVLGGF